VPAGLVSCAPGGRGEPRPAAKRAMEVRRLSDGRARALRNIMILLAGSIPALRREMAFEFSELRYRPRAPGTGSQGRPSGPSPIS